MKLGVSTANLYPMPVEKALDALLAAGIRLLEVFLNTESEAEPAFARKMKAQAEACGAEIRSVHSFYSSCEPFWLFSDYDRRLQDGLKHFERVFRAASVMGARYVIIHGDRPNGVLSPEMSAERLGIASRCAEEYGIVLLQENVVKYRSESLEYLRTLRRVLGNRAQFVFDYKQCGRCGLNSRDVIDAMGGHIRHVHISDRNAAHDCLPPGEGSTDYAGLFRELRHAGFNGAVILELYRNNFETMSQLLHAMKILENFVSL